jgi:hypothetical protein
MRERSDPGNIHEYREEPGPGYPGKRGRPKAGQADSASTPRESNFKLTLIAIVIMIILTPLAGYINMIKQQEDTAEIPDDIENIIGLLQSELQHETYYASVDVLTGSATTVLEPSKLQSRIQSKLDFIILTRFQTKYSKIGEWSLSVNDLKLNLMTVPSYISPDLEIGNNGIHRVGFQDTLAADRLRVVPSYYQLEVNYRLDVENNDDSTRNFKRTLGYQVNVRDIYPFMEHSQELFDLDANTPGGKIQRMVTYMLTTLVRHRLKLEYGLGPYESPLNVLNEGDIELAVNLAVIFEELSILKSYDKGAVEAIDKYYKSARNPDEHKDEPNWSPLNPTTRRYWSTAEMENFDSMYSYVLDSGIERSIEQQLTSSLTNGNLLDPADILALYMIFDREFTGIELDPSDDRALLDELLLWDPRQTSDTTDVNNIKLQLNLSQPYIFRFWDEIGELWSQTNGLLKIDHDPDYLVVGKNIFIDGLTAPLGWYTDVKLTKTRTPGVAPTTPSLPQHDFRMQWDLDIRGSFDLNLGALWKQDDITNILGSGVPPAFFKHDVWCNRTIELDFPVSIYGWLATAPLNNAIRFSNLNPLLYDFVNDTWIQRPEAQVKEFFSAKLWDNLKPFAALAMRKHSDELQFARIDNADRSNRVSDAIMFSDNFEFYSSEFEKVLENTNTRFWEELELFTEFYLWNYTDKKEYLSNGGSTLWLLEGGFNITIEFSDDFQDVTFILNNHAGKFKLHFKGISMDSIPQEVVLEGEVAISASSRIQDLVEYSYSMPLYTDSQTKKQQIDGTITPEIDIEMEYNENGLVFNNAEDLFGFGLPAEKVEHQLPANSYFGRDRNLTVSIGIFDETENTNELQNVKETLGQNFYDAAALTFKSSSGIQSKIITTSDLTGYVYALTELLKENDYIMNTNKIVISFNSVSKLHNGNSETQELAFYVETASSIKNFVDWISINNIKLISALSAVPYSMTELSQMFTNSVTGLDESDIENIRFYSLLSSSKTYVISGKIQSLIIGTGVQESKSAVPLPNELKIIHFTSIPQYSGETNIAPSNPLNILLGDVRILTSPTIPKVLTLLYLNIY